MIYIDYNGENQDLYIPRASKSSGTGGTKDDRIVFLTQDEYDALENKEDKLYVVTDTPAIYFGDTFMGPCCSPEPPEPVAQELTLIIPDTIVGEADTAVEVFPEDVDTDLEYSSSDETIATIDENGHITVLADGEVTFCVYDNISELEDCKTVSVELPEPSYLDVSPKFISEFIGTGGTYNVSVVSDDSWTTSLEGIVSGTDWVSYSPASGTGDGVITVVLPQFPFQAGQRSCFLVITNSDGNTKKVLINQGHIKYVINPSSVSAPAEGGTYTLQIISPPELNWSVSGSSWFDYSPSADTGNGSITITIPPNIGDSRTGSVVIDADDVYTIPITQEGADYPDRYLTISALEDGSITAKQPMQLSRDGGITWVDVDVDDEISLEEGEDVNFRGELTGTTYCFGSGSASTRFDVFGNIASLQYGEEFSGQTSMLGSIKSVFYGTGVVDASNLYLPDPGFNDQYRELFWGCSNLTTAPELPSTTLTSNCYASMFRDCTSLATAPELPATTLAYACYQSMFLGCASLEEAPELPATTLAAGCYYSMFRDCTSLEEAPELPATASTDNCYASMFQGCTSLENAPDLPATTLAANCYDRMFLGCTSLSSAPELPATDLSGATYCYYLMFRNCTSLEDAPDLPATTLANGCYHSMFYGCTSLISTPALPATTLANFCYSNMFLGCVSLTTAPDLPATTLVDKCYSSMFSDCTNLNYIKCLATDISATECTLNWLRLVAASGTFVKNQVMNDWPTGNNGIPANWTVVDA